MEKRGDIIPVMRCRRDDPGAIYLGTRTGSQDPPRDNPGTSFGPGTSRYCLFYWSVTPIFFLFFFFRPDRRKKGDRFKGARLREKGEGRKREKGEEEGKRKKKRNRRDRIFRRARKRVPDRWRGEGVRGSLRRWGEGGCDKRNRLSE